MWRLCLIADKLLKMIKGGGQEEGGLFSSKDLIPLNRRSHSVDVPHVRQLFNWDCGLACVLMVLKTLGIDHYNIHDLEKLCCTTSIWTVDLAYLLHKFSVSFSFLTVTLGVNPEFSAESFYREQLQDDVGRVDGLFKKALEAGISIQVYVLHVTACYLVSVMGLFLRCRSISGKDISVLILSGQCIAVALVDKMKLRRTWLKDVHVPEWYGRNSDYMGHYVIICGYDADTDEFEIRDPASSRKSERVPMQFLDEARKSFGTDEDILLCIKG
ncbi:guanylyl cyclase 1 isoform X2 [Phoenix dactylifera]|uniref:Guanylyl cyclase 1 isoform X2 n=1 Tax=Phoenix dactylifera TaxID=42345 RepID=A0A8B8JCT5_PHODC|nr:guanylyl cyclase 1 isoform X2 [Phoenix dactylifera]